MRLASAGSEAAILALVESAKRASRNPWRTQASVVMMPGPPALVTMATRSPLGMGWEAKATA